VSVINFALTHHHYHQFICQRNNTDYSTTK